jgi:predicted nucleic acid-binding protein
VDLVNHWHILVKTHDIKGLKSHDARLVAAMQTHGIARILTFNANDFKGFPITVIDPATV